MLDQGIAAQSRLRSMTLIQCLFKDEVEKSQLLSANKCR